MSPRKRMPSGRIFLLPPMSKHVTAFLMSAVVSRVDIVIDHNAPRLPKILGATLLANRSYRPSLLASCWNSSSSSGVKTREPGDVAKEVSSSIPRTRRYG
jgi:hypothetical protein